MDKQTNVIEQQRLEEKLKKRQRKLGPNLELVNDTSTPIHCACLIHGDAYDWSYVDRLYNMISRNMTRSIIMHVYTECSRTVPSPYVKHNLINWGIDGPKKAWWYKLQLFNSEHYSGPLMYFDLDTVITGNIDWVWKLNLNHFWGVRDFKYLWRPNFTGINSSIMWWDTAKYNYIWKEIQRKKLSDVFRQYHGDQDYITEIVPQNERRFFNTEWVKSWRWQCLDGGYNFSRRIYLAPGTGTNFAHDTSILVFHGNPKPHEITDPVILLNWQ